MTAVASETFTSTSAPIQYAAVREFVDDLEIEAYLNHVRLILRELGHHLVGRLTEAGIQVQQPAGGFYLFPDFVSHASALHARGVTSSPALCDRLLEETAHDSSTNGLISYYKEHRQKETP